MAGTGRQNLSIGTMVLMLAGTILMFWNPATWVFWVGVGLAVIGTGINIISALTLPKPRAPKSPQESFSFASVEAKAEEGMPVGLILGRNKIGGQILSVIRKFYGTLRGNANQESLHILIGLCEGICEGYDPTTQNEKIFINNQPLSTYTQSTPNPVSSSWWSDGSQTEPVPEQFANRLTTNYPQQVEMQNDGDKFTYKIKNQFAQGVKIGLSFLEGLYTLDTFGPDAGSYEPSNVIFQVRYRDLDNNSDTWHISEPLPEVHKELTTSNVKLDFYPRVVTNPYTHETRAIPHTVGIEFTNPITIYDKYLLANRVKISGITKITKPIKFEIVKNSTFHPEGKFNTPSWWGEGIGTGQYITLSAYGDYDGEHGFPTHITFTKTCNNFSYTITGESGAKTEAFTYERDAKKRIINMYGTVTYTTSGNRYYISANVDWGQYCIVSVTGTASLLSLSSPPAVSLIDTWIDINPPLQIDITNLKNTNIGLKVIDYGEFETSTDKVFFTWDFTLVPEVRNINISGMWTGAQRYELELWFPEPTATPKNYEVQIEQISQTPPESGEEEFDKATIVFVEEFELDRLSYPNTALLGLSFVPTKRLSGGTPEIKSIWDGLKVYTLEETYRPYKEKTYYKKESIIFEDWFLTKSDSTSLGSNWVENVDNLEFYNSYLTNTNIGEGIATYSGTMDTKEYTISGYFLNTTNAGSLGYIGGFKDTNNYHYAILDYTNNELRLYKKVNGTPTLLASKSITLQANKSYFLSFDCFNNVLRVHASDFNTNDVSIDFVSGVDTSDVFNMEGTAGIIMNGSSGARTQKSSNIWITRRIPKIIKVYGRNPVCILYTIYKDVFNVPESSFDIPSFIDCRNKAFSYDTKFDYPILTETKFTDFIEAFKASTGFYPIIEEGKIKLIYDKEMFKPSGTITSNGTTITGIDTKFLSECAVNNGIFVEGQTRYITNISSNTSLLIGSAFSPEVTNKKYLFTDPIVLAFTDKTLDVHSYNISYKPQVKLPNVLEVKFRDENNDFEEAILTVQREDVLAYEPYEAENILLFGVTNKKQAQIRGNILLNTMRLEDVSIQFKTTTEALHCGIRDLISITHTSIGWTNKLFKIDKITRTPTESSYITIEATAFDSSIYLENGTPISIPEKLSFRPPTFLPEDVNNLTVAVSKVKGLYSSLTLQGNFQRPDDTNFDYAEIYLSTAENELGTYMLNSTGQFTIRDVQPQSFFVVTAISVSKLGRKAFSLVKYPITINPYILRPPNNIEGFGASYAEGVINFKWDNIEDTDLNYYEIREGDSWENGVLVATNIKQTTFATMNIPFEGIYTYWIKAFDIYGDESVDASDTELEIPDEERYLNVYSREEKDNNWIFHQGTLTSDNTTNKLYLANNEGASSVDDFYKNLRIEIEQLGQAIIKSYTGSTREITLFDDYALSIPPNSGFVYKIYGTENMFISLNNTLEISSRKKCEDFRMLNKG